jgi:hypothetical protein
MVAGSTPAALASSTCDHPIRTRAALNWHLRRHGEVRPSIDRHGLGFCRPGPRRQILNRKIPGMGRGKAAAGLRCNLRHRLASAAGAAFRVLRGLRKIVYCGLPATSGMAFVVILCEWGVDGMGGRYEGKFSRNCCHRCAHWDAGFSSRHACKSTAANADSCAYHQLDRLLRWRADRRRIL